MKHYILYINEVSEVESFTNVFGIFSSLEEVVDYLESPEGKNVVDRSRAIVSVFDGPRELYDKEMTVREIYKHL